MASGPITWWQIDGETVTDFILGGSKITADGDCSHEIKRCLLFGKKATTNLDSVFKSRDITLPTKVRLAKVMVFPVVMYGCESWTIKRVEHWRIDAFELCCWPLWIVACQAPLSMGFPRQDYWTGLPFPSQTRKRKNWLPPLPTPDN